MWARMLPDDQRVVGVEAAVQRLAQRRHLLAQLPVRQLGEHVGSVVPATSASSIARPDLPRMSVATESSLMSVSSSIFCSRLASRWRSRTCVVR